MNQGVGSVIKSNSLEIKFYSHSLIQFPLNCSKELWKESFAWQGGMFTVKKIYMRA